MINKILSFGKQIPTIRCNVQETKTKKFVPATLYEADCKNISDYETVRKAKGDWCYKDYILSNMRAKMLINNIPGIKTSDKFYILKEDKNDDVIGMVQVRDKDDNVCIKYIESKRDGKYKYAGQNMVASIADRLIKRNGKAVIIDAPIASAIPFYTTKCHFQFYDYGKLILPAENAIDFIKMNGDKTQTPLIDLQG